MSNLAKPPLLARNTILNLLGQGIPMIIGFFSIPIIINGLGKDRFGLLSLAWVILGYLLIFDLGLGRATTKFVAEALARKKDSEVPLIVWTAISFQVILGLIGSFILRGITPFLVTHLIKIPPGLMSEAKAVFYLIALSIPIILMSSSLSGVLEAKQRFDLITSVRMPSSVLSFLLPLIGISFHISLPKIVALMLASRFLALVAFFILDIILLPEILKFSLNFNVFRRLFSFGSWITISNLIGPFMVYLDRFLIASLISITAVTYYSAPHEVLTRLWILPGSLAMTLFPAFSSLEAVAERKKITTVFAKSLKYILLFLGPIVVLLILFSREIIKRWLGSEFVQLSSGVWQFLALGILINSLAQMPYACLQGVGRPDLTAKFHLVELPFYLGAVWVLTINQGVSGTAMAWVLRMALDAILLFYASFKLGYISPRLFISKEFLRPSALITFLSLGGFGVKRLTSSLSFYFQAYLFIFLLIIFIYLAWKKSLDESERKIFLTLVKLKNKPDSIS